MLCGEKIDIEERRYIVYLLFPERGWGLKNDLKKQEDDSCYYFLMKVKKKFKKSLIKIF